VTRRAESLRRWKENGGRVGLSEWDFLERVGGDANGTNGMNGARLRRYAFREDQHWSASVNCEREDCHYGRIHLANGATHHFIISTSPGTLLELGTLVLYVCIMLYDAISTFSVKSPTRSSSPIPPLSRRQPIQSNRFPRSSQRRWSILPNYPPHSDS